MRRVITAAQTKSSYLSMFDNAGSIACIKGKGLELHNICKANSKAAFPEWFIHQALDCIGSVPLVRREDKVSVKETMRQLAANKDLVLDCGLTYGDAWYLISIFSYMGRGPFFKKFRRAKEYPEYSGLVPLWMYAVRNKQKVKYSEWDLPIFVEAVDKKDPAVVDALLEAQLACSGKYLGNAIVFLPSDSPTNWIPMPTDKLKEMRKLTLGNSSLDTYKVSKYMINNFYFNRGLTHMLCQTYLANVQYRHPNMILNPWDLDDMPKAYDDKVVASSTSSTTPKIYNSLVDDLWSV